MNYYNSKYGLYNCWLCLCEVCTRIGCPMHYRFHDKVGHCIMMMKRDSCPQIKCDFFRHREKFPILRVKSRRTRTDSVMELLLQILDRLDQLEASTSDKELDKSQEGM